MTSPIPLSAHKPTGDDGVVQRVRIGAYGWIERDGAVLLVRVAAGEAGAGRWMVPGGGVDFGEDPAIGALREIREETGIEATLGELLGIRSALLEPGETKSGHRIQAIGILYRATAPTDALRNEVDESTDLAAWIPLGELDALPCLPLVAWARALAGR